MSFWDIFKKSDKKTAFIEDSNPKSTETNLVKSAIDEIKKNITQHSWKSINIFVDRDYNLYGVPQSEDTTHQITVSIEPVTKLEYPYSDEQLEEFFKTVFGFCFSYYVEQDTLVNTRNNPHKNRSPIQNYMKALSWKAAVKDLGLINILWWKSGEYCGYHVMRTWQNAKMKNAFSFGYIGSNEDVIVPTDYQDYELAKAFRKVLDVLAIGPCDKNPYENE
ncbi:MAG: hypothetical protein IJA70_07280 [Oscillospiraceae bacterium]|nr:hypothetical protein [Oscillospiraceae bacterium]